MRFLVDADVLSEPTKPSPSLGVIEWLRANEAELAVSTIVLGEIEYGIRLLPAGKRRKRLQDWFARGVQRIRTLDFDAKVASTWAELLAHLKAKGRGMPIKDSLSAATALAHDLTVATHNTADYRYAGAQRVDPFAA